MSLMKTGHAGCWVTHKFEYEVKTGHLHFLDWLNLKEEFWKDFMLLDSEATAINVLETTAHFQGKQMVNDYLDQFHNLIYNSVYTNPKTLVVKFCRGLDCLILTALTGMASRRLLDTNPEAWYCLVVQIDQNQMADEVFQLSYQTSAPANHLHTLMLSQPTLALPPAHFTHSNSTPGNLVPIDIDTAHKAKTPSDAC